MSEIMMMTNGLLEIPSHLCVPRALLEMCLQGNIVGRNLSFLTCRLLCAYRPVEVLISMCNMTH